MSSFTTNTAKYVSGAFIGFIVISFIFTFDSSQNMVGGATSVAKVGSHEVKVKDFENEYNMQVRMLSFQNGGKSPTSQQLEMFRVRHRALQTAIQKKLLIILAEKSGISPSEESIRETIRKQEVFQTEGQFDFAKYKNLLTANRYTPQAYEELIKKDIQIQQAQSLFNTAPVSTELAESLANIKKTKREVHAVEIKNENLKTFITIAKEDINSFLAMPENMKKVEELFQQRKAQLSQKEQVKARHILFKGDDSLKKAQDLRKKLNKTNFADLAKKNSEGPSASKGGDLGWFGRGAMVQEFENKAFTMKIGEISAPIKTQFGHHIIYVEDKKAAQEATLKDHQVKLAKELLLDTQKDKLDELRKTITEELKKTQSKTAWEKVTKKYKLSPVFNRKIDRLSNFLGPVNLNADNLQKIFSADLKSQISLESEDKSTVVAIISNEEVKNVSTETELAQQQRKLGSTLDREMTKLLWDEVSVSCLGQNLKSPDDIFSCPI